MQTPDYPLTENYNQNENLIKNQQQNNQQNIDINQFFVQGNIYTEKEKNKYVLTYNYSRDIVVFFVFMLLIASVVLVLIKGINIYFRLISIILGVIISLLLLIFSINKIEITKDSSNNKIIIKEINFLCFPIKIIKIDRENFHFIFIKKFCDEGSDLIKFYIINDFKNLVDIDLDTSNIKLRPVKFYYIYNSIKYIENAVDRYTGDLNNFLGISSDNYENPLYFDINGYMNKNANKKINFTTDTLSKYMKFSEHFFTFHLKDPSGFSSPKKNFENIYRIDCIFSRNFDRIFIGLVKYTKTSYVNTFDFQMNNIDRFILENISFEKYNLVVIFKNGEKQLICNIENSQKDLEGLAYLLNEKLIKNKENMNPTIY